MPVLILVPLGTCRFVIVFSFVPVRARGFRCDSICVMGGLGGGWPHALCGKVLWGLWKGLKIYMKKRTEARDERTKANRSSHASCGVSL